MIESDALQRAESDLEYLHERKVGYFVHFTALENVESILEKGLLPRSVLDIDGIAYKANDAWRFDGRAHVNLSITHPNTGYFFKVRKENPERCYVVLRINPGLLRWLAQNYGDDSYKFMSTNAASRSAESVNVESLFAQPRDPDFVENWTSDPQAELLVGYPVPREFIDAVVLPSDFGKDPERVAALALLEERIAEYGLRCEVFTNELFFENVRQRLAYAGNREKYEQYFLSWDTSLDDYAYIETLLGTIPSLTRFDSTAFALKDLEWILTQKSSKDIRPGWSLKYRKELNFRELAPEEVAMLTVLEKIINRSRIGVLSGSLEADLNVLIAEMTSEMESSEAWSYTQWAFRVAHQIQASVVELIKQQRIGWGARLYFTMNEEQYRDLNCIAEKALGDLLALAENLGDLYGCAGFEGSLAVCSDRDDADLVLNWSSSDDVLDEDVGIRRAHIYGFAIAGGDATYNPIQVQSPVKTNPTVGTLTFLLNYLFRFEGFREGQYPALARALGRKDTIVLLPTGSGKSIVFQLLALITPGTAFIVSPITSLIDDQVMNLEQKGIDRVVGLTGQTKDKRVVERSLATGSYLMCYVAPERFQILSFVNAVRNYARTNLVSVVAVDEAHCVSEWGHDFRTSYLGLARSCRGVCSTGDHTPPLLALTGTASLSVLVDMKHDLEINDPGSIIRPKNFDRPEIHYRVIEIRSDQKLEALDDIIWNRIPSDLGLPPEEVYRATGSDSTKAGIIFCQNVNGSYGLVNTQRAVEAGHPGVWDYMEQVLPGASTFYCGSKPKRLTGGNWDERKRAQALSFKKNEKSVMVATKAFGMGIDKPNVRWVVHFGMPGSLESYYQEVGRAARDRKDSYAYLILSDDYPQLNNAALDPAGANLLRVQELEESKGAYKGDDVSRCLFFHSGTFEGVDEEMRIAEETLAQCTSENYRFKRWEIPFFGDGGKNATERAIYRLTLLGAFKSYNVEYHGGAGSFIIEPAQVKGHELRDIIYANYRAYIESYQSDRAFLDQSMASLDAVVSHIEDNRVFILAVLRHLLQTFTYRVIEEGRRRAIMTMLEAARRAASISDVEAAEENLRAEIISYLNTGDDEKEGLAAILYDATNLMKLTAIVEEEVARPQGIVHQALRLLEDYPQHYGLYYIVAAMQVISGKTDEAARSLSSMFLFGMESYGLSRGQCADNFLVLLDSEIGESVHIEAADRVVSQIAREADVHRFDFLVGRKSRKLQRMKTIGQLSKLFKTIEKEL